MIDPLVQAYQSAPDLPARRRAGDALLREYDGLCVSTARRYRRPFSEDMVQAARIGLLAAADSFDPEQGAKFATHAVWQMKHEMREERVRSAVVWIPHWAVQRLDQGARAGVKPDELADAGIVTKRSVLAGLYLRKAKSTDEVVTGDSGARATRGDRLISEAPTPEEQCLSRETYADAVVVAGKCLTKREQEVIMRRLFGESCEDIGASVGLSRQRVKQIQDIAMAKMQKRLAVRRTTFERRAA